MSSVPASTRFAVDYGKRVSSCKRCRQQLFKGDLRMAKIMPNFFIETSDPPDMKQYFHLECLFDVLTRARHSSNVIESSADIEGWEAISDEDKSKILTQISELEENRAKKFSDSSKTDKNLRKKGVEVEQNTPAIMKSDNSIIEPENKRKKNENHGAAVSKKEKPVNIAEICSENAESSSIKESIISAPHIEAAIKVRQSKFDAFRIFCRLCDVIDGASKSGDKTLAVRLFVTRDGYNGDLHLLSRFLLPSVDQRIYNLKEKQLIKLFSNIFKCDSKELTSSFDRCGDISTTVEEYFKQICNSTRKSTLTNQEVDDWLDNLSGMMIKDGLEKHLHYITQLATPVELKYILRLILKDLRIKAGPKHILEGFRVGAYEEFRKKQDLQSVIKISV